MINIVIVIFSILFIYFPHYNTTEKEKKVILPGKCTRILQQKISHNSNTNKSTLESN